MTHAPPNRKVFWALAVPGWALVAYGVWGVLAHAARTVPRSFLPWFLGALVVHDALIAPLAFATGVALKWVVRGRTRVALQAGLIVAATLVAASLPVLAGPGRSRGNPSLLPNAASASVAAVAVAAIVLGTIAAFGARRQRAP